MRSFSDPRHVSRILCVMFLYQNFYANLGYEEFTFPEILQVLEQTSSTQNINYSKKLVEKFLDGLKDKNDRLDSYIDTYSSPVKSKDLDPLSLVVLRLAIYEGFDARITPPKVAVDEAIELLRDFGADIYTKKVAGILGKIYEMVQVVGKNESNKLE